MKTFRGDRDLARLADYAYGRVVGRGRSYYDPVHARVWLWWREVLVRATNWAVTERLQCSPWRVF